MNIRTLLSLACLTLSLTAAAQKFNIPTLGNKDGNKTPTTKLEAKPATPQAPNKEKSTSTKSKTNSQTKLTTPPPVAKSTSSPATRNRATAPATKGTTITGTTEAGRSRTKELAHARDLTTGNQVEGVERSTSQEELEERAAHGDATAHTQLGMLYFQKDDERAMQHLKAGSEAGDPLALYYLGAVYYAGKFDIEADKRTAAEYFLQSAQKGHAPAQFTIAVCLYNGEGVRQDLQAARSWMEKAAGNNYDEAKAFLETHSFE